MPPISPTSPSAMPACRSAPIPRSSTGASAIRSCCARRTRRRWRPQSLRRAPSSTGCRASEEARESRLARAGGASCRRQAFPGLLGPVPSRRRALAWRLSGAGPFEVIVTITRGGLVPAAIVARELGIRVIETISISSYRDKAQAELSVLKAIAAEFSRANPACSSSTTSSTPARPRASSAISYPRAFRHGLCEAAGAAARRHVHHRGVAGHLDLFPLGFGAHLPAAAVAGGGVRVRTLPAWAERIQDHRGPGTIIIADLEASSQISEEAVRQYLSPYVQFLPVPVLVNGQNISQKQFENAVEGQASGFVSRPPRNVFRGAFAGELQTLINPQGRVIARTPEVVLEWD